MSVLLGLVAFCGLLEVSAATCTAAYADKIRYCKTFQKDYIEGIEILIFEERDVGLINSSVFSSPSLKSVLSLTLRGSKIHTIETGAFQQFHGLTNIELQNNSLTTISPSWFHDPATLKNLTMAGNLIRQLRPEMLDGFSGLERLNLSGNEISAVSMESFHGLTKISSLDLSSNKMSSLQRDALSFLNGTVRLGGNPWDCSCAHEDFMRNLRELVNESRLADPDLVTCRFPPELNGSLAWNVSDRNCSVSVSLSPAAGFHKTVLPALFVLLALSMFILLVFLVWKKKQDKKQVRPDRSAAGGANATGRGRVPPPGKLVLVKANLLKTKGLKATQPQSPTALGRAKSASAILLQADFSTAQHGRKGGELPCVTRPAAKKAQTVHSPVDASKSDMEMWYYNSLQSNVYQPPTVNSLLLTGAHTRIIQNNPSSAVKDFSTSSLTSSMRPVADGGHPTMSHTDPDVLEPIVYLCVTTAHEEPAVAHPVKKEKSAETIKPRPLRRACSWPKERLRCEEDSSTSYQNFLKTLNISPKLGGSHLADQNSKDERFPKWDHIDSMATRHMHVEGKVLPRDTDSEMEPMSGATYTRKKKVEPKSHEGQRRNAPSTKNIYHRSSHDRCAHRSKVVTPESGTGREDLNSQGSEARSDLRSTPDDDKLLENNEYSFIDLLHEVVENHGRWTRERWRQTHQQRVPSRPSPH